MHKSFKNTISLVSLTLLSSAIQAVEKNAPNVLFIAIDDLKPELGCYGNKLIKTPNIDKLAAKGTLFTQSYCQQAVSGPTRASLLTGKRPDYTKVWDLQTLIRDINPDIVTLPQYFAQNGYTTTGIGKIFDARSVDKMSDTKSWTMPFLKLEDRYYHNNRSQAMHYQAETTCNEIEKYKAEAIALGMKTYSQYESYIKSRIFPSSECIDIPDNGYVDGANTLKALDVLTQLSKSNKPFFFGMGYVRPHLPFVAPKKYWDLYDRNKMPLATFQVQALNSPTFAYHNSGELRTYTDIPSLVQFTDLNENHIGLQSDKQKELIHGYYATISYVDAQIGLLMNKLDELGIADNTVIVLWGDHGWHLGDHDLWCKHSNFEQATRTPLIFHKPGLNPSKYKMPVEFVDIFPTLCELTGINIPAKLDGVSLFASMQNNNTVAQDFAVSQYPRTDKMGYSIRTERYRYTVWYDWKNRVLDRSKVYATELYDYEKDPLETVNVANENDYEVVSADLKKKMELFFEKGSVDTNLELNRLKANSGYNELTITRLLNGIIVINFDPNFSVDLYDVSGQKLTSNNSSSDLVRFDILKKGIYFIRNENRVTKLIF
jgi:arylsulfatase A-like enzyme